jgi:hypothetical protein
VGGLAPKQLGSIVYDLITLGFRPRNQLLEVLMEGEMALGRVRELREALGALVGGDGETEGEVVGYEGAAGVAGAAIGAGYKGDEVGSGGRVGMEEERWQGGRELGKKEVGAAAAAGGKVVEGVVEGAARGGDDGVYADGGGESLGLFEEVDWDEFIDAATKGVRRAG